MKKFAIILTIVAVTAMIFSSCAKYDEGPSFTLLTKKARLTGTWEYNEMLVNDSVVNIEETYEAIFEAFGIEITNFKMTSTLEKDGTGITTMSYTVETIPMSQSGDLEWEFNDTKEYLRIKQQDPTTSEWEDWEESKILKLTNSELWVETTENDVTFVYKLIKAE